MNLIDSCEWLEYLADGPNANKLLNYTWNKIFPTFTLLCFRAFPPTGKSLQVRLYNRDI